MTAIKHMAVILSSALLLSVSLTACGSTSTSKSSGRTYDSYSGVNSGAESGSMYQKDLASAPMMEAEDFSYRENSGQGTDSGQSVTDGRKLIRTVQISIKLPSDETLSETVEKIAGTAVSFNGYITYNDMSYEADYAGGTMKIQIPKEKVDAFLEVVKGQGHNITGITDSSRDVTEEYVDTEARIKVQQQKIDNYQRYLEEAQNISETLEVSDRLNNAIADMEANKARLNVMSKQVEYTEITVGITCEHPVLKPSLGERVSKSLGGIWETFVEALLEALEWFAVAAAHLIFVLPVIWVVIRVIVLAASGKRKDRKQGRGLSLPAQKGLKPGTRISKPDAASGEPEADNTENKT